MAPEAALPRSTYDEIPYGATSHSNTSIDRLATVGALFGVNPPPIERARVLELGCARGANLMPMAVAYPGGTFVGVDLSAVQIDTRMPRDRDRPVWVRT